MQSFFPSFQSQNQASQSSSSSPRSLRKQIEKKDQKIVSQRREIEKQARLIRTLTQQIESSETEVHQSLPPNEKIIGESKYLRSYDRSIF